VPRVFVGDSLAQAPRLALVTSTIFLGLECTRNLVFSRRKTLCVRTQLGETRWGLRAIPARRIADKAFLEPGLPASFLPEIVGNKGFSKTQGPPNPQAPEKQRVTSSG
jgi:hypothetical protein